MASLPRKHSKNKTPKRREAATEAAVVFESSSQDTSPITRLELLKFHKAIRQGQRERQFEDLNIITIGLSPEKKGPLTKAH